MQVQKSPTPLSSDNNTCLESHLDRLNSHNREFSEITNTLDFLINKYQSLESKQDPSPSKLIEPIDLHDKFNLGLDRYSYNNSRLYDLVERLKNII